MALVVSGVVVYNNFFAEPPTASDGVVGKSQTAGMRVLRMKPLRKVQVFRSPATALRK